MTDTEDTNFLEVITSVINDHAGIIIQKTGPYGARIYDADPGRLDNVFPVGRLATATAAAASANGVAIDPELENGKSAIIIAAINDSLKLFGIDRLLDYLRTRSGLSKSKDISLSEIIDGASPDVWWSLADGQAALDLIASTGGNLAISLSTDRVSDAFSPLSQMVSLDPGEASKVLDKYGLTKTAIVVGAIGSQILPELMSGDPIRQGSAVLGGVTLAATAVNPILGLAVGLMIGIGDWLGSVLTGKETLSAAKWWERNAYSAMNPSRPGMIVTPLVRRCFSEEARVAYLVDGEPIPGECVNLYSPTSVPLPDRVAAVKGRFQRRIDAGETYLQADFDYCYSKRVWDNCVLGNLPCPVRCREMLDWHNPCEIIDCTDHPEKEFLGYPHR